MVCGKCGEEIASDTTFCPYCGESTVTIYNAQTSKEREAQQSTSVAKGILLVVWLIAAFLGVVALILTISLSGPSSKTAGRLSEADRREAYYNITATQDQNPYSTEWGEGVKQAAADHYGVPRSTISDIILEGATKGWLLPDPP